jgi:lipoprotein-releasing system permease protein
MLPRTKRFKVVGTFDVGYDYDRAMGYLALNDAQKLYHLDDASVTGLQLKLDNLYAAPRLAREIAQHLPHNFYVSDWTVQNGTFFAAVKLEKTLMFVMLSLIIAVAAFNILSTLVMVVTDKQADIAILRTIGATPATIMRIFFVQGSLIGIIGTFIGLILGVLLALNVTAIVAGIEHVFSVKLLSADVYYISYLPSKLLIADVIKICGASLVMSFLATLYPAWNASRIQPAEALRYE